MSTLSNVLPIQRFSSVATLLIGLLLLPTAASARETIVRGISGNDYRYSDAARAYFLYGNITGPTRLDTDISGAEVFVGKDSETGFNIIDSTSTPINFQIFSGATITEDGGFTYPNGLSYTGIQVFGGHTVAVTGGQIGSLTGYDTSVSTISSGLISTLIGDGNSLISLSGGTIETVQGHSSSSIVLGLGSTVTAIMADDNSNIFFNGANLLQDVHLAGNSLLTVSGNNLNAVYSFYEQSTDSDVFDVVGTRSDSFNTPFGFQVRVFNDTGIGNSQIRQIRLNTVVPESGTLSLVLAGFVLSIGHGCWLRRRARRRHCHQS